MFLFQNVSNTMSLVACLTLYSALHLNCLLCHAVNLIMSLAIKIVCCDLFVNLEGCSRRL